ncbi:hypothetical protein SKAU_G00065390 [Synaphobranchus kaupii]|uniref:Uncharacterized protein n=1 Tax=Synaphobranchus kaupii TaxID=118154 RepID=A0A9Q1J904_SYNKA|nr:hypothetical protein SKAU_G00065390 [Synaphobranchus kaupii]
MLCRVIRATAYWNLRLPMLPGPSTRTCRTLWDPLAVDAATRCFVSETNAASGGSEPPVMDRVVRLQSLVQINHPGGVGINRGVGCVRNMGLCYGPRSEPLPARAQPGLPLLMKPPLMFQRSACKTGP